MSLIQPLKVGDFLTVFSDQNVGATGCIGVTGDGCCYPLNTSEPVAIGAGIVLTEESSRLETPWSTDDPKLQVGIQPLLTFRYGWMAHNEAEGYLWSRDGGQRRVGHSVRGNDADYRIADLQIGVYVRFEFSPQRGVTPIVVHMTHDGPEESLGATVDLDGE
jgi:hypothetical protein